MTNNVDIRLYNFLKEHETHLYSKDNDIEVIVMVDFDDLEEFSNILGSHLYSDGIECHLMDYYIALDLYSYITCWLEQYITDYKGCFGGDWQRVGSTIEKLEKKSGYVDITK